MVSPEYARADRGHNVARAERWAPGPVRKRWSSPAPRSPLGAAAGQPREGPNPTRSCPCGGSLTVASSGQFIFPPCLPVDLQLLGYKSGMWVVAALWVWVVGLWVVPDIWGSEAVARFSRAHNH